jgi:hypothetical protein
MSTIPTPNFNFRVLIFGKALRYKNEHRFNNGCCPLILKLLGTFSLEVPFRCYCHM